MRILKQQFQQLAIIIGNVFVNALRPAIQALNILMAKVIQLAQVISNALGKIFGWKYIFSGGGVKNTADSVGDLSDSLGSANDNAKKLKNNLLGIDELNIISPNDDSSSGSGGGGGISDALADATSGGGWQETEKLYESFIDDLESLGEFIGEKLKHAMDNIDWDSIYERARGFGKGLADFLNGLISPSLFYALGRTIASALNTAIYASLSFTDNFDFENFGRSLGAGINGFFNRFDFKSLAESINGWLNGIKDTIVAMVEEIKWDEVISGIKEFLENLDWGMIKLYIGAIMLYKGAKFAISLAGGVANLIKQAIVQKITTSINWAGVASGVVIGSGVLLTIDAVFSIVREIRDNWDAIRDGDWNGVDKVDLVVSAIEGIIGIGMVLGGINRLKSVLPSKGSATETLQEVTNTTTEVSTGTSTLTAKLKELAVNLLWGIAIIAEVAVAVALIIGAIALFGLELQLVAQAWQPVIDNASTVAIAMGVGAGLMVAIGVVTALLGTAGSALAIQMGVGILVLAELGVATGLFLAEIWGIGVLLQQIAEAWQPVLDNGEMIAESIGIGTGLLVGIGIVTVALGAVTVASAGTLPLAIGIGTALLVELGIAFVAFVESLVVVADCLTYDLAPALSSLNEILPSLNTDMKNFTTFMEKFAGYVVAYSASSVVSGLSATIDTIIGWFTVDPFQKLADDVNKIYGQVVNLNTALNLAVPELQSAITLLTSYNGFLEQLAILSASKELVIGEGLKADLTLLGENIVVGFAQGIKNKYPMLQTTITNWGLDVKKWFTDSSFGMVNKVKFNEYGKDIVNGFRTGVNVTYPTSKTVITTWANTVIRTFTSIVNRQKFYQYGQWIVQGFIDGVNSMMPQLDQCISQLAQKVAEVMEMRMQIGSPSKLFRQYGVWTVEGFNIGINESIGSTVSMMDRWGQTIATNAPQIAFEGIDASDLSTPSTYDVESNMSTSMSHKFSAEGIEDGMEEFFTKYLQPMLTEMASDVKRQADKEDTVEVQIGNRVITDSIDIQRKANGFSFVRG